MSGRNEFTSSQEIGDVGNESIKSSSTGVATDIESGGEDILALDSEVVEQDDKMNEDKAGIQVEEGLNLLHKQEEIDVVPNNNIHISSDIHARLGAYKHFVDLDNAQIALLLEAITTYPHLWNASKKFSERFQAWRLKILADMLLFLQKESVDSVIPQREKEFHKLCEEAIEVGFESSWVEEMRQRVVARDPKLGEDIAKTQIDENSKSLLDRCSCGDTVPDSQGDGPNITFEEGSNSVDKGGEIVVSNDHIVAQSNEEPEQEFVAEVSTSEIPIIATSLTNSQPVERPTPSYFYIPLRETPSNALVDTQRNSEPFLMNQKKSVGEIPQESNSEGGFPDQHALEETIEIGDVRNENIKEGSATEGAKTKSLSYGVEDISIEGGVATHIESGGMDILAQYSKVVEQDDKMNEGNAGIVKSREIQVEEGLIPLDKQEEINIVSNNNSHISPASADIRARLGAYKHFVDLDDAQIALLVEAITAYPHLWNACQQFSERFQAWRLKILADMLVFLQKESVDSFIPQREKEFHKLCKEAVEIGFESSWVEEIRQRVVARDPKLGDDIAD
ncbi:uncharacterized protein LOC114173671 isoform X3 [Vigna unguiculata]|uniref:uncharacterized protein LOC114173671 isoform X3 n=1 Tax=Vigna unguiculata TaxID=3917 RepID=UPI0010165EBC|nr:uncharacterized protein LOC114173671 isoform X3 [Vigna unguiculata]